MKPIKTSGRLSRRIQANLRACYNAATLADRSSGLEWHDKAHNYALDLGKRYGYTVAKVAGVIAALSPGNVWTRNLSEAETLVSCHRYGTPIPSLGVYGRSNVDKAVRCLESCDDSTIVNQFSDKTGPKTRAFYRCIAQLPDDTLDDVVVIDRHAASAALNSRGKLGGSKVDVVKPSLYRYLARHFVDLASKVGLKPYQVQAICWNSWKTYGDTVPF